MLNAILDWIKKRVVWFKPVPTPRDDVRGGGIGFRFWF
jgi:hypothetical protein